MGSFFADVSWRAKLLPVLWLFFIGVACTPAVAADAEDELGNWLIYNGTLRFSDKWSLFTEAQLRLWELASNPQEFFVRGIGLYQTSENTQLGFGYTWVKTEAFEDEVPDGTENRLIEQFSAKQRWLKSAVEHRFRLEQRWIEKEGDTTYQNRFRYRLQATTPLFKDTIGPRTHFLNVYNEIFLGFGNVDDTFDQNRLYGAYGWQFSKAANLQLGALWQAKKREDFFRLQIFYTHNFDLRN
ncbi:MAG: DUF2490 domain-containing protein [Gammaproteobacteria bacterium]